MLLVPGLRSGISGTSLRSWHFMPLSDIMDWIILALMTMVIARATYDYYPAPRSPAPLVQTDRGGLDAHHGALRLSLHHPALPGVYYPADVFACDAGMFLLPIGVGWYLLDHRPA